jgi:signal transduction histidine kinase
MIEYNVQPTDFALSFEGHCYIGWANHQKEGVEYIVENRFDKIIVNIDDTNIGRVIEQVIANATKHTDSGFVRAHYDYVGDRLMIVIEDTGSGIAPDVLKHIYERFASGNNNGTGLGLPICKEIIEQMNGNIYISTKEGKGTTVCIIIPCEAITIERKKLF